MRGEEGGGERLGKSEGEGKEREAQGAMPVVPPDYVIE
jgi:hypothetical protein